MLKIWCVQKQELAKSIDENRPQENQVKEQEFDVEVDPAEMRSKLRGHQNLALVKQARKCQ